MALEPHHEEDGKWRGVQDILVEVRETAITKEEAVQSIQEKLGLHDPVRSLLLQLCDNEITVDDVKERLLATVTLIFLGGDEPPAVEDAINSLLSERLRRSQVTRRTFQIKQAMGDRDPVQEVVEEVERGNISVQAAVDRLRDRS